MILIFQSSFRLSEKNEKDKKRKELTPVSATPTHMLRICVNPPIVAHTKNSAQFLCKITKCKFVLKKDRLFHIFIV